MDAAPPLLLLLLVAFSGKRRTVDAVSAAEKAAVRSAILTHYNAALPPPGEQLEVQIYMEILNVDLYGSSHVMQIDGLLYVGWKDSRLSWTGSEVKSVDIYTDEIWVPDVGVLHRWHDDPEESSLSNTRCVLLDGGDVQCMPPADLRSPCRQDHSRWPYALYNCTLRIGSKLPLHELKFDLLGVDFVYEAASRKWDELQISPYTDEDGGKSNVVVTIQLKRHSLLQVAAFVAPAFVLVLLTVSSWLLPSNCNERLLLAVLTVFLHCIVIDSLSYAIPENGAKVPQVVLMYRDLLVVAAASFMAAVCLRGLSSLRPLDTPVWLPTLLESTPARFLLCSSHSSQRLQEDDDAEGLVSDDEAASAATPPPAVQLARLINRLGLLASTATCVATLSIRLMA